jgi:hypothetical protein
MQRNKIEETVFSFCPGQVGTCHAYPDMQNSEAIVQLLFSFKIICWGAEREKGTQVESCAE